MKGFGRKIQWSIMGGIIFELKKYSETVIIDKFFPSTKLCPNCGALNKLNLDDRIYKCGCGYSKDRDIHSANNILIQGLSKIGRGPINTMPLEKQTSAKLNFSNFVSYTSMKEEAATL